MSPYEIWILKPLTGFQKTRLPATQRHARVDAILTRLHLLSRDCILIVWTVIWPLLQIFLGNFSARNENLGHEAVENLKKELGSPNGDKIRFHKLDVTKKDTIDAFRDHLKKEYGGIDILINNAGIAIHDEVGHWRTLAYCLPATPWFRSVVDKTYFDRLLVLPFVVSLN